MARDAALTIDDAYAISLDALARRQADGEKVIGKKIGVTSKAVQDMLGVHQPDFGFRTDRMWNDGDIDIAATGLIQPRPEAEIAPIRKTATNRTRSATEGGQAANARMEPSVARCRNRIRDTRTENVQ